MRNLDFSQNPIGDKGFSAIINSLQNITETLNLRNCGISKAEMEKFAKKLNDIGNTVIHTEISFSYSRCTQNFLVLSPAV